MSYLKTRLNEQEMRKLLAKAFYDGKEVQYKIIYNKDGSKTYLVIKYE